MWFYQYCQRLSFSSGFCVTLDIPRYLNDIRISKKNICFSQSIHQWEVDVDITFLCLQACHQDVIPGRFHKIITLKACATLESSFFACKVKYFSSLVYVISVATCCSPRGWCSSSPDDCLCDDCQYYEWDKSEKILW